MFCLPKKSLLSTAGLEALLGPASVWFANALTRVNKKKPTEGINLYRRSCQSFLVVNRPDWKVVEKGTQGLSRGAQS